MNIYLYGPSGSGKSTVGQLLARELNWRFIDLDVEIVSGSGQSIPDIFNKKGEAYFRMLEENCLKEIALRDECVIALGGGSLVDAQNRALLQKNDPVILLSAGIETLLERLQQDSNQRPLLAENVHHRLEKLLEQRKAHYDNYKLRIATNKMTPTQIVWEIQLLTGCYRVGGMGKEYSVQVRSNGLNEVGKQLNKMGIGGPVVVASDNCVGPLYGTSLVEQLSAEGFQVSLMMIQEGDDHKDIDAVGQLWHAFLEAGLDRKSTVLALGGGVVGDLVGFAAATYLRGVNWINFPTSVLAMVDASLGGKTGANLAQGKNLIGSFHAPVSVMADTSTLATLPERHRRNGLAEVIKHGVIADPVLFSMCAEGWESVEEEWDAIIKRSIGVKVKVIQKDPFEGGVRQSLNLGHTIGHGIEKASGYKLLHGEAVAVGMVIEARIAESLGLAETGLADQIRAVLEGVGLPVDIPAGFDRRQIVHYMQYDKKKSNGKVRFALPAAIGDVKVGISVDDVDKFLI
jgi:shikimate kinase / 3-dehydroquinate synthase